MYGTHAQGIAIISVVIYFIVGGIFYTQYTNFTLLNALYFSLGIGAPLNRVCVRTRNAKLFSFFAGYPCHLRAHLSMQSARLASQTPRWTTAGPTAPKFSLHSSVRTCCPCVDAVSLTASFCLAFACGVHLTAILSCLAVELLFAACHNAMGSLISCPLFRARCSLMRQPLLLSCLSGLVCCC